MAKRSTKATEDAERLREELAGSLSAPPEETAGLLDEAVQLGSEAPLWPFPTPAAEVVATTGDPAFAVDPEGPIIAWNEAAEHCLGYRRSEVVGCRCWRLLRGQDLFSNRYCGEKCSVRDMAPRGEPVHRTQAFLRTASGERARFGMSTLVVRGEARPGARLPPRHSSVEAESRTCTSLRA